MIPTEIKFLPYRGPEGELKEGKKTKICLYRNRLVFFRKFTSEVVIQFMHDDEPGEIKTADNYCDEEGYIAKDAISSISKYIETEYKRKTGEPYNVQKIDIVADGIVTTFTFAEEEDKNKLYTELDKWKWNLTEEKK